ncbi:hypothetical protein [Janthinobacterium lividum]|uniref:hypothetical protein n=1 Tax=Janthinobacterium lividum TaxID=29581 RepID=UPI0011130870|nr:hypothetical protein [Janthinobacterium lividum]MCC7716203.1 hypothetical protein [Janthinobacterium lividum]WQE28863.1 hypothetical protein U0004_00030 [Janthinobacterium lividum]
MAPKLAHAPKNCSCRQKNNIFNSSTLLEKLVHVVLGKIVYEKSYISALEIGAKEPPTEEFTERTIAVLSLSPSEKIKIYISAPSNSLQFHQVNYFS